MGCCAGRPGLAGPHRRRLGCRRRAAPGLAIDSPEPPTLAEVRDALAGADLVVIENLCSLPLNPAAAAVVAAACAGRPSLLHHHDLPWQRPHLAHLPPPPDDPAWAHVTINELSRAELAARGVPLDDRLQRVDPDPPPGEAPHPCRPRRERRLPVLLQPTRASRGRTSRGLALTEAVGGTYWLLGPAEDGYGPELDRLVGRASCPVVLGHPDGGCSIADRTPHATPSCCPRPGRVSGTLGGVGDPSPPAGGGPLPGGGRAGWLRLPLVRRRRPGATRRWLREPDDRLLMENQRVAAEHFNLAVLPGRLSGVLREIPGLPPL